MNRTPRRRQGLLAGTVRVFAAEMLIIPTGILTVVFLTRNLGPAGYGMLAIAAAFVDWAEWGVTQSFTRATVKFVSEAKDWRPVATRTIQLQFLAGTAVGLLLVLLAAPIAALMGEPELVGYLRLYALDLPVFCLAQAHRDVLVGLGYYRERAVASAWRWLARLALIVLLVELGLSIHGAILGGIASSLVELAICRWYAAPALFRRSTFATGPLWIYLAPLSLYALSLKLYDKLDLVTFKALGGTVAAAGVYASAEGMTTLPTMLATAFAPLLLSSLGASLGRHGLDAARERARRALRGMLLLIPLAGVQIGMSRELTYALYGDAFLDAARLFAVMASGSIALFMAVMTTSIIIAAGRPGWTARITIPLVLLQGIGNLLLIPRMGALGAALVTSTCAFIAWIACTTVVHRLWRIHPPVLPLLRNIAIGLLAWLAAVAVPAPGAWAFLKFATICLGIAAFAWWSGELRALRSGVAAVTPAEPPAVPAGH